MNSQLGRNGVTVRLVIGTLCALFFIPAMMVIGALFSWQQQSQAQSVAQRAQAEAERARADAVAVMLNADEPVEFESDSTPTQDNVPGPSGRYGYRPVTETKYEEQIRVMTRPVVDPNTGKTRMVQETVKVNVPVSTTAYRQVAMPAHGPKVMQLVKDIRGMDKDDEGRKAKIDEMKALLTEEFQQQHEQQGKEIEQTEKRLEELKKTHSQRTARKDEIVERRVNQLTGHPDILQWSPTPNSVSQRTETLLGPQTRLRLLSPNDLIIPPPAGGAVQRSGVPTYPAPTRALRGSTIGKKQPPTVPAAPRGARSKVGFAPLAPPPDNFVPKDPPAPGLLPQTFRPNNPLPPVTGDAPRKIESIRSIHVSTTSSTSSTDVFDLAKQLSSDLLAVSAMLAEQERIAKLHQTNAITDSELQQHEVKLERATRQAALARAQWNAMSDRLKRGLQYAEKRYERTRQQADAVRDSYKAGEASMKDVLEAEGAAEKAQQTLEDLKAELEQFVAAEKLIGDSDDDSKAESGTDSTNAEPRQAR
jgi:Tfp pilus assembly protein FimT